MAVVPSPSTDLHPGVECQGVGVTNTVSCMQARRGLGIRRGLVIRDHDYLSSGSARSCHAARLPCSRCFASCSTSAAARAAMSRVASLARERSSRRSRPSFSTQCARSCARTSARFRTSGSFPVSRFLARRSPVPWDLYSRLSSLGKADGNGLLRVPHTVLPFSDMMNLFAHEFSCLRTRSLALASVFACPLNGLLFWHFSLLSPFWMASAKPVFCGEKRSRVAERQ